jgi:hypothetical protein
LDLTRAPGLLREFYKGSSEAFTGNGMIIEAGKEERFPGDEG